MAIRIEDFVDDQPWSEKSKPLEALEIEDQIRDVVVRRLLTNEDDRGGLTVLFSNRLVDAPPPPHIYWVSAAPGSVRAWVYHKRQYDRLAFTNGHMRVVLYDLRPGSPTYDRLNVIDAGEANKVQITIPPFVVHGVQNVGKVHASFVNMPSNSYDPAHPDKSRVVQDHPDIPYRFE